MTIELRREDLVTILGATCAPCSERIVCRGIQFDSRAIQGGELFVALKGEKAHGHEFVEMALSRGAALCLVEDPNLLERKEDAARMVVVSDTLRALWSLANWWRRELKIPVLAITGSVGKTTVKEMVAAILLRHSIGVYSLKSHNNHTGVPLSILRATREHKWAVLEMGMNHAGELTELSKIAEPDLSLINIIAPAHIEYFKTLDAIADAKLEIQAGMAADKLLILNGEDAVLKDRFVKSGSKRKVLFFGAVPESESWIEDLESNGLDGIGFSLCLRDGGASVRKLKISLSTFGKHNALNAAAAALAAKTLFPDISDQMIVEGLSAFRAPLMRLNLKSLPDGRRIVDDSYNANPASMRSLLHFGQELSEKGQRVGLILGDMLELGSESDRYHRELASEVVAIKPSFLIAVGTAMAGLLAEAKAQGISCYHAENPEVAAQMAKKSRFDVLLVKGSRGIGLDRAVTILEG